MKRKDERARREELKEEEKGWQLRAKMKSEEHEWKRGRGGLEKIHCFFR